METAMRKALVGACALVVATVVAGPVRAWADVEQEVTETQKIEQSDDGSELKIKKETEIENDTDVQAAPDVVTPSGEVNAETSTGDQKVKIKVDGDDDMKLKVDKDDEDVKVKVEQDDDDGPDGAFDLVGDVVAFPFKAISWVF